MLCLYAWEYNFTVLLVVLRLKGLKALPHSTGSQHDFEHHPMLDALRT